MPKIPYPECGKIINTHGCHGGLKVEPWCDSPSVFAGLPAVYLKKDGLYIRHKMRRASVFGAFVFCEIEGVADMESAGALKGSVLFAAREDLPIGDSPLIAELIGLPVFHAESGRKLGVLSDVIHPGASDIYVIRTETGEAMVPAVPSFVKSVDAEAGISILPIEGMFDDAL